MNEASLSDTIYFIRGVKAHKPCAVRVLSYYQWQSDEIAENGLFVCIILTRIRRIISTLWMESNLAPTCQSPTCEGRSRVQVETREMEIQEERINQKTPTHICREDI